jgi:hypothetical protein
MKSIRIILLIMAAISFISVIGGSIYEHLAVVPKWKIGPPASLAMFQGKYGIDPGKFWKLIHPVTLVLLIATLIANWKTGGRKYIMMSFASYLLILIITAVYFVPELMKIIHTPYSLATEEGLVSRASLWEKLSLIRLGFSFLIASMLLFSFTKIKS